MEFILQTDLEKSLPLAIEFNFDAMKAALSEKLTKYNSLVVTEDSIKSAKSDRAKLNSLKTAVDNKRKEVKKKCLAPYEDFEKKIKEITTMIDQPILAIDKQVKAFDEIKKEEKRNSIEHFYNDNIGDLSKLLPLEKLWNDKWLNVTVTLISITQEIMDAINKFRNDYNILKAMRLECEQQVLDVYMSTLDMSAALAEKARFEEQQKRIKAYDAAQNKSIDIVNNCNTPELLQAEFVQAYIPESNECPPPEEPKTIKVIFYDTTEAFRHEMKALTEKHNIRYGGLK